MASRLYFHSALLHSKSTAFLKELIDSPVTVSLERLFQVETARTEKKFVLSLRLECSCCSFIEWPRVIVAREGKMELAMLFWYIFLTKNDISSVPPVNQCGYLHATQTFRVKKLLVWGTKLSCF